MINKIGIFVFKVLKLVILYIIVFFFFWRKFNIYKVNNIEVKFKNLIML